MSSEAEIPFVEGEVDFEVQGAGKPCKTWYKIFGTFPSPTNRRPLIALHGGPGVPHNYLLSIRHLASDGRPVIFYDQLGCGNSTRLPHLTGEAGASFWTIPLFLSELNNLITHLKISSYDLFGNSWGGVLAASHAVTGPKGLNKLILADSLASMPIWNTACGKLISNLPEDVQEVLRRCEEEGTTESEEYEAASMVFYEKHVCRVVPFPKDLVDSFAAVKEDNTVYLSMNGPNEFLITGTLKTWSTIPDIPKIKVPTLLINGRYDEAQDECMEPFFKGIENVQWEKFEESSHVPHIEETEKFIKVVKKFLDE